MQVFTHVRIEMSVPTAPEYYGSETSEEDGQAIAEAVREKLISKAEEQFPGCEITVRLFDTVGEGNAEKARAWRGDVEDLDIITAIDLTEEEMADCINEAIA